MLKNCNKGILYFLLRILKYFNPKFLEVLTPHELLSLSIINANQWFEFIVFLLLFKNV